MWLRAACAPACQMPLPVLTGLLCFARIIFGLQIEGVLGGARTCMPDPPSLFDHAALFYLPHNRSTAHVFGRRAHLPARPAFKLVNHAACVPSTSTDRGRAGRCAHLHARPAHPCVARSGWLAAAARPHWRRVRGVLASSLAVFGRGLVLGLSLLLAFRGLEKRDVGRSGGVHAGSRCRVALRSSPAVLCCGQKGAPRPERP